MSNPLQSIEQMSYLIFMKRQEDMDMVEQNRARGDSFFGEFNYCELYVAEARGEVLKNELPEGWKLGKLGEIGEIILGVTYKSHEVSEIPKTGYIPILRTNNINYELNFDDVVYVPEKCINQKQLIKAGDIVIAMSSGSKKIVGKAAQSSVDVPFAFGAFCGLFRCNSHIDTRYIGFFFKTPRYRSEISHLSRGANINNLRKDNIRNITIPVPPLETQRKIVAILEKAEATQRLRAEADALTQELVQSVFLEMRPGDE